MHRSLSVAAIIFICLPCIRQKELGNSESYNYDPILTAGLGLDGNIAKRSIPGQLVKSSDSLDKSGLVEGSREIDHINAHLKESLSGNLNSYEDLKKYLVDTDGAGGGLKTNGEAGELLDTPVPDELPSKNEYVGTSEDGDEQVEGVRNEFQSNGTKENVILKRYAPDSNIRIKRQAHPSSPCPGIFSYEGPGAVNGKWYGEIILTTDATLNGVKIEIRLDKTANLLESALGKVSSSNNIIYSIWSSRTKLVPGTPLSVRITVNYNENGSPPPRILIIKLNGRQICPRSSGGIITLAGSSSRPSGSDRPTRPGTVPSGGVTPTTPPISQPGGIELVDGVACGRPAIQATPFITNGQRTARGQWPWHAAIYQSKGADLSYICGGSLIGKKSVITAAHCVMRRYIDRPVDSEDLVIYLGKYHLKLWSEGGVQDRQVLKIKVHPEYNSTDFRADIAILELSSAVEFNDFVKPICLWDKNRDQLTAVEGQNGVVVGWGFNEKGHLTEDLMMAKMPVVSQQTCIWSYPQFFSRFTSDRTFCAGFRNGTSVCNGDSGGGMVFPKDAAKSDDDVTWALRGIVSLSTSLEEKKVCNPKNFVVFTDVVKFYDWIQKNR